MPVHLHSIHATESHFLPLPFAFTTIIIAIIISTNGLDMCDIIGDIPLAADTFCFTFLTFLAGRC